MIIYIAQHFFYCHCYKAPEMKKMRNSIRGVLGLTDMYKYKDA